MATTASVARIGRIAVVASGVAAIGALIAPAAAFADSSNNQFLAPGASACVSQYAAYQVRADATASNKGAKFRLYRNGAQVAASPTPTTSAWAAEFRTWYGNFPGAGTYTLCAANNNSTNTFVTLRLRSDGEI